MSLVPSWQTLGKWWHRAAVVIVIGAVAFGITAFAWAVNNSQVARDQGQTIIAQNKTIITQNVTIKRLSALNLTSQNNHHAATTKTDAQLKAALAEVKDAEAAISYEGGVITFLLGEIAQGQAQGHQTLAELQTLQMEVTVELPEAVAALQKGQAEINAYLGYLTCLGTNQSNTAICGPAPPLPST